MQHINNISAKVIKYQFAITKAISRVIDSGYFILGPEVKEFEQSFAAFLDTNYCIGVGNGTDAIELALKAMGLGSKSRIATVANAGMYVTTAILAIDAEPYFMDVDLNTHNVTLAEVVRAIEAGVQAVVVTHLYGLAVPEIELIAQYCSQHQVWLLEDCAQAHGAQINSKRVGIFGDAASFSFYPTKNLGALGDGGAVVTNHPQIAEKVLLLRQYGWTSKYQVNVADGRNSRLDEMQAAILSVFLCDLETTNAKRREIAARYSAFIRHPEVLTPPQRSIEYVAHLYVVRSPQREALRNHLRMANIGSDVHYPIPDHRQPVFNQRFSAIHLHNTERLANEVLTLPCYPEMNTAEVDQVISVINNWKI